MNKDAHQLSHGVATRSLEAQPRGSQRILKPGTLPPRGRGPSWHASWLTWTREHWPDEGFLRGSRIQASRGARILFFFEDVEKKVGLRGPRLRAPWWLSACWAPLTGIWGSRCFGPQPRPAVWLRREPGCRRPSGPWAVGPNGPLSPAPACRVGLAVSGCSLPRLGGGASGCNGALGAASGAGFVGSLRCGGGHRLGWLALGVRGGQCSPLPWRVEVWLWGKSLVGGGAHACGIRSAPPFPTHRFTASTHTNHATVSDHGREH